MTEIRHSIQTVVLNPTGERLVSVLAVSKAGSGGAKKARDGGGGGGGYFLSLSLSHQTPVVAKLRLLKASKGVGGAIETRKEWELREVEEVDGINPRRHVPDLSIRLRHKVYRWEVSNVAEKEPFVHLLYKLQSRYALSHRAAFVNVSIPVSEMETEEADGLANNHSDSEAPTQSEDFAALTEKEERDFRALLSKCEVSVGQAEAFQARLVKQLSLLDAENIQQIMGQEAAVESLLAELDQALKEAEELEALLERLDALLEAVRESVEAMQEKDAVIGVESHNRRRLAEDLEKLILGMELLGTHQEALADCKLETPQDIHRLSLAAAAMHKASSASIPPGLSQMKAFKDQQSLFKQLGDRLAERLLAHLTTLFQQLAAEEETAASADWHSLMLPKHSQRHHALKVFSELVGWLSENRLAAYKKLQDRYVAYTKDLYAKHLGEFFTAVRGQIKPSTGSLDRKPSVSAKGNSANMGRSPALRRAHHIDRDHFIKLLETLLSELEPVVLDEQKFVVRFLHLHQSATSSEKAFVAQVHGVLEALFAPLPGLLEAFVKECERAEAANIVFLFARLSRHVLAVQDAQAYIAVIFGSTLVKVKRNFDEYMKGLEASLREVRLTKKVRVGIVEGVGCFAEAAGDVEFAWRGVERKAEAEKWLPRLLESVWAGIEATAEDPNSKSPPSVLRMENYHRLHSILMGLKISALEGMGKQCKAKYQAAVEAYSRDYMGRPLDRLAIFFDRIQTTLDAGMRPEEVGYQAEFSRTELRKLIAAYPGKELWKGLDSVYRKLEKHLGGDSTHLQVVWHQMQADLIDQYQRMEKLMGQCYPNTGLRFEFSLQDLLGFFAAIAQQH